MTLLENITGLVKRDFPYLVVVLLLLGLLLYTVGLAADHEKVCDDRYRDFVNACYRATGKIPDVGTFNLNLSNRTDGQYWMVTR